jgi:hypothetical protein
MKEITLYYERLYVSQKAHPFFRGGDALLFEFRAQTSESFQFAQNPLMFPVSFRQRLQKIPQSFHPVTGFQYPLEDTLLAVSEHGLPFMTSIRFPAAIGIAISGLAAVTSPIRGIFQRN